jgi:flagellar hook protein FlgE
VVFDSTGKLTTPAGDITITISPNPLINGATIGTAGALNWKITSDANRQLTGYTSESTIRSLYADGYAAGELRRMSVDTRGVISGVYTNGQTLELYQIALANFQDQSALASSGNYFLETSGSGQPTSNRAGTAGLGNIQGNALESSNTDISKEFISMIMAQRAYQANARVITTADNMLTELMNIKR